jgi:hypothetical protein
MRRPGKMENVAAVDRAAAAVSARPRLALGDDVRMMLARRQAEGM